jgi:MFS family permease
MADASTPAPPGGPSAGHALDPRRQRAVLIVLAGAALMVMYVETMIIPGIHVFVTFFQQPLQLVTWILSAYLLVGVAFTPIAGKLGDIYGKKRVLVAILVVYFVAVATAGFTPNLGAALGVSRPNQLYLLIGVRAVQGTGMAMFPLAFALIGEEFPRERVARAQGLVAAMFSVGSTLGLLGGAYLTQQFGWQFTYHTVVPVALIVLALAVYLLEESPAKLKERIDVPGALFLALSLVFLLLGLTEGPTWGWAQWNPYRVAGIPLSVPLFLALAVVFLVAFLLWENRTERPILDFAKLTEHNILVSNVIGFLAGTAMFLMFIGLVARAEFPKPGGLGLTTLQFGLLSLPTTMANLIAAPLVGRAIQRNGPKGVMLLGSALIVVGGVWLAVFNSQVWELVLGPIPILVGIVTLFIAMVNVVVVSSRPQETGVQTGMNQTFRNLGTALGPVGAATILASLVTTYAVTVAPGVTVPTPGPTTGAYELLFALIAVLGAFSLVAAALIRNFRIDATGRRIELGAAAGRPGPASPTAPTPAPTVTREG